MIKYIFFIIIYFNSISYAQDDKYEANFELVSLFNSDNSHMSGKCKN